ncbi:MAG: hypothetical protein AB3X44_17180 [Leptothrix sp. (in: b-proteobacteria)]
MDLQRFAQTFGLPLAGSAVELASLGLPPTIPLRVFADAGLRGVFGHGLLSIASSREQGGDLGRWARYLPAGGRLLASSAFGFLFATSGLDLWVIDPLVGQVMESDIPIEELPGLLCETDVRQDFLREALFRRWYELNQLDLVNHWLCPTPVPALGGSWTLVSLRSTDPGFLLSFTEQLFDPTGPHAVSVRRLSSV